MRDACHRGPIPAAYRFVPSCLTRHTLCRDGQALAIHRNLHAAIRTARNRARAAREDRGAASPPCQRSRRSPSLLKRSLSDDHILIRGLRPRGRPRGTYRNWTSPRRCMIPNSAAADFGRQFRSNKRAGSGGAMSWQGLLKLLASCNGFRSAAGSTPARKGAHDG